MLKNIGKKYLVLIREDLLGQPEGKALKYINIKSVGDFIWKKIFYRQGIILVIILDGGSENRGLKKYIFNKYKTQVKIILAYHLAFNGIIKTGHKPIKDALLKIINGTKKGQVKLLLLVLFTDRTTVKRITRITLYKIFIEEDAILLIETEVPT